MADVDQASVPVLALSARPLPFCLQITRADARPSSAPLPSARAAADAAAATTARARATPAQLFARDDDGAAPKRSAVDGLVGVLETAEMNKKAKDDKDSALEKTKEDNRASEARDRLAAEERRAAAEQLGAADERKNTHAVAMLQAQTANTIATTQAAAQAAQAAHSSQMMAAMIELLQSKK